ncbi:MAG: DUF4124 domain-containing protein [Pseudoxanthomonas sp.]
MRLGWAILGGLVLGGGLAWWSDGGETRARMGGKQAAGASAPQPSLYRWRDDAGVLHVTSAPPQGRRYQRVPLDGRGGDRVTPMPAR